MTSLASSNYLETTTVNTKAVNTGGRSMPKKSKKSTGTRGLTTFLRNWSKQKPSYHQRTNMLKTCGKKCFLGPCKTFPICTKNTCKRNRKGIYAAYIRAQEYKTIKPLSQKYQRISRKARKLLHT